MNNLTNDDYAISAMGNGHMVVYGQGPNIINAYGPTYSSPNLFTLGTRCSEELIDQTIREIGTEIRHHDLKINGESAVRYTEFVAAGIPAYIRRIECKCEGIEFIIHPHPAGSFIQSATVSNTWMQHLPAGQRIFNYPSDLESFLWVISQGSCFVEKADSGELKVKLKPGIGSLIITSAFQWPEGEENIQRILASGVDSLLNDTRVFWNRFTARRYQDRPELANLDRNIQNVLDGVAVLIKAQQSECGGVMAGHFYPLAYIRDQYGTAKGMLSLGMIEEARKNLLFRYRKFQRFGTLQTAETMGTNCARHMHENDEVEGPAYTILQARDYLQAGGDTHFLPELLPMLEWCWDVQKKHVINGLLPFNGDETYVAGGFFPRSGLLQGSADSTLVFAEAGLWLAKWAQEQGFWNESKTEQELELVAEARAAYLCEFVEEGRIWANAPIRELNIQPPAFRHGVCEGMCGWFGWTRRSNSGRYLCPNCLGNKNLPESRPQKMQVNSVALLPAYIESDILPDKAIEAITETILAQSHRNGHIPTVPDTSGCVGYDPGLLLISLTRIGSPHAKTAAERIIRMLDSAGAWVEYYDEEDRPRKGCCKCRPWESAINAYALLKYLLH